MAERDTNKQEVWDRGINDLETPPVEGAFLAEDGWRLPLKGTDPADGLSELIVAVGQSPSPATTVDATEANVDVVAFLPKSDGSDYEQGDTLRVAVYYNEKVDVTVGATINVTSTGTDFLATAAAQTDTNEVIFEGVIPAETADLSILAQSIIGTIVDTSDATASDLAISADAAAAAETISIA
jgi:hypothetical protein